jgi:hypothetical protein
MSTVRIQLTGKSNVIYSFQVYSIFSKLEKASAVCLFTSIIPNTNNHTLIYLESISDLSVGLDNFPKIACIKSNNASHISILLQESEDQRQLIIQDIRASYKFACNDPY